MIYYIPAILPLAGAVAAAVEAVGADYIHVDVMDGHFVPNITIGPVVVEAVRKITQLPLDVHLMIEDPDRSLADYIDAGADMISVHVEAAPHLHRTVSRIREAGRRAGVAINPATPAEAVREILPHVDFLLVMTVNPGFGGQQFIKTSLVKIKRARKMLAELPQKPLLEVDGGVNLSNISAIAQAGADVLVAGAAVFGTADYAQTIAALKAAANKT